MATDRTRLPSPAIRRKPLSDVIAKAGGALDLRATQFADPGHSIGAVRSIAQGTAVPRDLPVDRPAMTAEPASDLPRSKAHFDHAAQAASLIKREVAVFGSHGDPGHSRCRTWFGNLAARLDAPLHRSSIQRQSQSATIKLLGPAPKCPPPLIGKAQKLAVFLEAE